MNKFIKFVILAIPALVVSTLTYNPAYSSMGSINGVGKMATFEYLHVGLVPMEQGDLLEERLDPSDWPRKKKILREILEQARWDFKHRNTKYALLVEHQIEDVYVFRVGKLTYRQKNDGPDGHFPLEIFEDWQTSWGVFDITSGVQNIAIQNNLSTSPKSVLESFFQAVVTSKPVFSYNFLIGHIVDKKDFWNIAERYKGRISSIEFTFFPPNAINFEERIKALVTSANTQLGPNQTSFKHKAENGSLKVSKDDPYTNSALRVSLAGQGSARMFSGVTNIFSSSKDKKTKTVGNEHIPIGIDDKEKLSDFAAKVQLPKNDGEQNG